MELSIVILSYKMKRLVRNCLRYLQENPPDLNFEIIVVDNNSGDDLEQLIKTDFPSVKFIQTGKNSGMGAGNNAGIKVARGEYILILNPDIYITGDSIKAMLQYLKNHQKIGLIAPKLLNPDHSLQYTCYRWHETLTPLYRRTGLQKIPFIKKKIDKFLMLDYDHQGIKDVDWVQGSCMMLPARIFKEVGLFDESFFMYFEDTDLCRRIWLAGYKVVYLGEVAVIHMHMRMSGGGLWQIFTNKLTRSHIKSWGRYLWKYR